MTENRPEGSQNITKTAINKYLNQKSNETSQLISIIRIYNRYKDKIARLKTIEESKEKNIEST